MALREHAQPVAEWNTRQVYEYINGLEIGPHKFGIKEAMAFRDEVINGRLLLNLEKKDLNHLGIDHFAKRNALYDHIQRLKIIEFQNTTNQKREKLISKIKP